MENLIGTPIVREDIIGYLNGRDALSFSMTSYFTKITPLLLKSNEKLEEILQQMEEQGNIDTSFYEQISFIYLKRVTNKDLFEVYTDFIYNGVKEDDAFWIAAYLGDLRMMKFFIKHKFNVFIDDEVYYEAFRRGDIECLEFFADLGFFPSHLCRTTDYSDVLNVIAESDREDCLQFYLDFYPMVWNISEGNQAVLTASLNGNLQMLQLFATSMGNTFDSSYVLKKHLR